MNHKTWFGGPTDYFNFTPGPEVQAAKGTLADDSHPTEPPRLLINNDAPRKRANADNTPIPPKSSAASSDATSFKPRRPQLEVHTKLKTNILPGTQAVRLGPEDEGNGLKDQGSINSEEPQAAQPPSHDSVTNPLFRYSLMVAMWWISLTSWTGKVYIIGRINFHETCVPRRI